VLEGFLVVSGGQKGGRYGLDDVYADDAFECEELEDYAVLLQYLFESPIEPQTVENCYDSDDDLDYGDPYVCEVYAVRLLAVCSDCKGDDCCKPDNNARGNELKHSVPYPLGVTLEPSYVEAGQCIVPLATLGL
jgi:hypothetical protein